ncbi:hypothetical protein BS78_04G085300 [Paspalum vaginatum]|nr:hypothetical protein BS78_04G085300 [Paspalum vaginatum]
MGPTTQSIFNLPLLAGLSLPSAHEQAEAKSLSTAQAYRVQQNQYGKTAGDSLKLLRDDAGNGKNGSQSPAQVEHVGAA